jgi:hypothetical protein
VSRIDAWLDPLVCPRERPPFSEMSRDTRRLHEAIDGHARRSGVPYLHPDEPTVQLDVFGSAQVIAWQEAKAAFLFAGEGCWSELPHLYARYGTTATATLIDRLKTLEHATSALVCDSGMQATAVIFDVLMTPGGHAIVMRQIYNKTRTYIEWLAARLGGSVTIVDDGDMTGLAAAIRPETKFIFAETFTNPRCGRAARRSGREADRRFDHRDALGVQEAAARLRHRHRRGQRHEGAWRPGCGPVGLHRHA